MPVEGKYFQIISRHCGLALGLQKPDEGKGAFVVLVQPNQEDSSQVWYEDIATATIRCKANDLVMHVTDGENFLRLNNWIPDIDGQLWVISGVTIHQRSDETLVFDICEEKKEIGSKICAYKSHNGTNQEWDIVSQPVDYFYVASQQNGMVLDIEGASPVPGSKVVVWVKKTDGDFMNQLFYEDKNSVIRSAINDFCLDGSNQSEICVQSYDNDIETRSWNYNKENKTVCLYYDKNTVLDIFNASNDPGAKVGSWTSHGGDNQKWNLEYV